MMVAITMAASSTAAETTIGAHITPARDGHARRGVATAIIPKSFRLKLDRDLSGEGVAVAARGERFVFEAVLKLELRVSGEAIADR